MFAQKLLLTPTTTVVRRRFVATTRGRNRFKSSSTTTTKTKSPTDDSSNSVPIGASLLAAIAGVGVVATSAYIVDKMTAATCLPFSTNASDQRFSQDTFQGRFSRMLLACDPYLLIYTESQIQNSKQILLDYDAGLLKSKANAEYSKLNITKEQTHVLWESRRIVESAIHPDTGEVIPRPFRMSGYVPCNGPICVSMVASSSTLPILFWSWINQTQNALVNYYNRNASSPMTNETLMISYTAAVGSALIVALGLSTLVQKKFPPKKAKQMMKFVAFPSAVVASSLNCYVVRSPEIETGIPLMDCDGTILLNETNETSCIAAKCGVESTTISRAILQAPVYFVPSMLMSSLPPLRNLIEKSPKTRVPITTFMVLTSFGLGLPATVAIFPQISSISSKDVETKYQHLINPKTNKPYDVFYYNKGL